MSRFTEGVVLRAAIFLGFSRAEARNAWKLGTEYDHRVLVEDAQYVGFDLELARTHDRNWQDAVRENSSIQERTFLDTINDNKPDKDSK